MTNIETGVNHEIKEPHVIFIKDRFLKMVKDGSKTEEVRPDTQTTHLQPGDEIVFKSDSDQVTVVINSISIYKNLTYLLETADLNKILPGIRKESAEAQWKKLYPEHQGKISIINFKLKDDHPRN